MRALFLKIRYFFIFFAFFNILEIKADNYPLDNLSSQNSELLIESNKQITDLENSVFYAEGEVTITNTNNDFIAKSKKAIFYKLLGKIKLIGEVEVFSVDMNRIQAGEVIYYLKENRFEAIADENQKVNTKFVFNENNILEKTEEK